MVEIDNCPVADSELVAGAEMLIALPFVPERVRLIPDQPIVEPVAVVLPAVLAPSRFIGLTSTAAPGAATEAVMIPPALEPKVTLLALEKLSVVKANEPLEAEAAGFTPPPAAALSDRVKPLDAEAVVPDRLVRLSVGLPCEWLEAAKVVATVAVITELLERPNDTPLESANVTADRLRLDAPADTLMLLIVAALESIAVVKYAPCDW